MEYTGIFLFDGYFEAICEIRTDAGKWRMLKAIYNYETKGILPDEKTVDMGIFKLVKALIDGRRKKNQSSEVDNDEKNNKNLVCESVSDNLESREGDCHKKIADTRACVNKNKKNNANENVQINKISSPPNPSVGTPSGGEKNLLYVPTIPEIQRFIAKSRIKNVSPHAFKAYYDAKNWRIRGEPIKNWHALLVWWANNNVSKNLGKSRSFERELSPDDVDSIFIDLDDVEF